MTTQEIDGEKRNFYTLGYFVGAFSIIIIFIPTSIIIEALKLLPMPYQAFAMSIFAFTLILSFFKIMNWLSRFLSKKLSFFLEPTVHAQNIKEKS
jgi:hypothetical protein